MYLLDSKYVYAALPNCSSLLRISDELRSVALDSNGKLKTDDWTSVKYIACPALPYDSSRSCKKYYTYGEGMARGVSKGRLYPSKYGNFIAGCTEYGLDAVDTAVTHFKKFQTPTEVPTWGDCVGYSEDGSTTFPYFALQGNQQGFKTAATNPHSGMMNAAFLDGHAESFKRERWGELMDKINDGSDNYTSKMVPFYDYDLCVERNAF